MQSMKHREVAKFFLPLILAGTLFLIIYSSGSYSSKLLAVVSTNFLDIASGEITAVAIGIGLGINPLIVAFLIIFIESDISLFIALNFDLLKKLPKIGGKLIQYEDKMIDIMRKRKWIKHLDFFGVMIMASIPLYGTGALPYTIVGRLLGLG